MSVRWWVGVVWALAAGSAVFWGLKLFVTPEPAPAHARLAEAGVALHGDLTRLLGADAPPPAPAEDAAPVADARFQLVGVVSTRTPQAAREGVALIAVDGRPPRAYRVGAVVEGSTVLKSVAARGATLGPRDGPAAINLNLPPPAPAATGVLAPAAQGGNGSPLTAAVGAPMRQPPTPNYRPVEPAPADNEAEAQR